jgi:hypothetical protein
VARCDCDNKLKGRNGGKCGREIDRTSSVPKLPGSISYLTSLWFSIDELLRRGWKSLGAKFGAVAQLVAHLHGMQGVRGSSPLSSTEEKGITREGGSLFRLSVENAWSAQLARS